MWKISAVLWNWLYEHARDESFAKDDYFISTVISGMKPVDPNG